MTRLPVHAPRSGIASMSPVGVTTPRRRHGVPKVVLSSKDDSGHSAKVTVGSEPGGSRQLSLVRAKSNT